MFSQFWVQQQIRKRYGGREFNLDFEGQVVDEAKTREGSKHLKPNSSSSRNEWCKWIVQRKGSLAGADQVNCWRPSPSFKCSSSYVREVRQRGRGQFGKTKTFMEHLPLFATERNLIYLIDRNAVSIMLVKLCQKKVQCCKFSQKKKN
jgi:hypothetical protein